VAFLCLFAAGGTFAQHRTPNLDDTILLQPTQTILQALRDFPLYDSRNFDLKVKMIRSLGKKGNAEAVFTLRQTLNEGRTTRTAINNLPIEFWQIRAESALSLGRIGDKQATPSLLETALQDEDVQVQICAIRAIGMLQDPIAVPRLLDLLEKTSIDRIANEIVLTLGEIGDRRAFPLLLAVTQRNFTEYVRKNALIAIKKLKYD
jgi:HEAT repeat protein